MASSSKKCYKHCCVFGCNSKKGDSIIHFHAFPKKNSGIKIKVVNDQGVEELIYQRKAWERVLVTKKPITKHSRVCSKHFTAEDYCAKGVLLKQPKLTHYAVPSLELPERTPAQSSNANRRQYNASLRNERAARRQQNREDNSLDALRRRLEETRGTMEVTRGIAEETRGIAEGIRRISAETATTAEMEEAEKVRILMERLSRLTVAERLAVDALVELGESARVFPN